MRTNVQLAIVSVQPGFTSLHCQRECKEIISRVRSSVNLPNGFDLGFVQCSKDGNWYIRASAHKFNREHRAALETIRKALINLRVKLVAKQPSPELSAEI